MKPKVLIVEDDKDLSEIIKDHLSIMGCEVVSAANGIEAIKALNQNTYTCLMSDIKMPGMDGIKMIHEMRRLGIATPVVFMSGYSDYTDEEISSLGGVVLLEKPFSVDELSEIVRSYIELLEVG